MCIHQFIHLSIHPASQPLIILHLSSIISCIYTVQELVISEAWQGSIFASFIPNIRDTFTTCEGTSFDSLVSNRCARVHLQSLSNRCARIHLRSLQFNTITLKSTQTPNAMIWMLVIGLNFVYYHMFNHTEKINFNFQSITCNSLFILGYESLFSFMSVFCIMYNHSELYYFELLWQSIWLFLFG